MEINLKQHALGFLQIDPLPSQSELNEFYEKQYYQNTTSSTYQHSYSETEIQYINNKIVQRASAIINHSTQQGKILDIGCGEGFVLSYFKKLGWDVLGIDYSDYGLINFNPDLKNNFEKGDVYDILNQKINKGNSFDILWLGNVLEHVLDPIELLVKLKKLLSPAGSLVITVPNDGSKFQEMLLEKHIVNRKWWVAFPDHLSYFNVSSLVKTCEFAGFESYKILSDFPIDFFLMHSGSNYINDSSLGKEAHNARVSMENFIAQYTMEEINNFYSSLAKIGLGRDLTIFLR